MKTLFILSFLSISAFAHAAPLVGYSTLEPENKYKLINSKGDQIFSSTADLIKRVELRDGLALIQTTSNNVTLLREDGKELVSAIYGSEIAISKKLISVFTKNGMGAVYTLEGKKLFPAEDDSQTRPVKNIWIANDRFAVMDQWMETITIFDSEGEEVFSDRQIAEMKISDGFMTTVSLLGTFSIYDEEMDLITTDTKVSNIQISDELVGYVDQFGSLRLFSRQSGEFPMIMKVDSYSLNNTYAMVKDAFGISLYGKDKSLLENPVGLRSYSTSHELFAYIGNTGALWVKNEQTGDSFVVNQADAYSMSDDLLIVKNGMGNFNVFSLRAGSFGKMIHSVLDQTIVQFQAGNGILSFETKLVSGAMNGLKALQIIDRADISAMSLLVDEIRTNKVNISLNREEWNWK